MTAKEVLDLARSQLGVCEIPKGSNRGTPYHAWYGPESQGWQWCSIFVSWLLRRTDNAIKTAYSGDWLSWGRRNGREVAIDDVLPGDIVIFDYGDGGITDHIGIVEKRLGPTTFQTIEGNVENCVGRKVRTSSRTCKMWFVRPYYEEDEDMGFDSSRVPAVRTRLLEGHATLGKIGGRTENCYLNMTGLSKNPTEVKVTAYSNAQVKHKTFTLSLNENEAVNLSAMITGETVTWRMESDDLVLISPDWRVEW